MMKRFVGTLFAAILLGMSVGAGSARAADLFSQLGILDLNANGGINPATGVAWSGGDRYRLVFVSSTTNQATSSDIATYNTLVQNFANASSLGLSGVSWNAIGSTATIDARDNTDTDPNTDGYGEAFFLMNGTEIVATNYADFWDGNHSSAQAIDRTEENASPPTWSGGWGSWSGTWTGTGGNGTAGAALGSANPTVGLASGAASSAQWTARGSGANTLYYLVYGMSEVLTIQGLISLTDLSASDISTTTATLNATLKTPVTNANVYAYWGTTDGGTTPSAWSNTAYVGSWTSVASTNLSHAITSLDSGTVYYYSFSGSNAATNVWAESSGNFGTVGVPAIINDGYTPENQYATLSADLLSTGGAPTTVRMYWGDTDGGTDAAAWANTNLVSGTPSAGAVSSDTSAGLVYGIQYYFRSHASNANGVVWAPATSGFVTGLPYPDSPVAANMEAWYDAGQGVSLSGNNVTQWDDQSGNARHTTSVSGTPEFTPDESNGQPGIKFRNEHFVVNHNIVPREQYFVFRSGRYDSNPGDPDKWHSTWGGPFGQSNNNGWMLEANQARTWNSRIPISMKQNGTNLVLLSSQYYFTDISDYFVLKVNPNAAGYASDTAYIARPNDSWHGGHLDIAEVIIYSDTKSATDEANIGLYLASKYGIETAYSGWTSLANDPVSAGITSTSATFNATFRGLGGVFDVYAYWGTSDGGSDPSSWGQTNYVGSYTNADTTALSFYNNALTAGTDYYYTFSAQNAATNIVATPSQNFQTVGTPAANTAGGATRIRSGAAQLNGALSLGGQADIYFCWGYVNAGTGGGPGLWQNVEPATNAYLQNVVSADISGTLYGLTYYYACYASNAFGTAWSPVATFTTLRPIPMLVTSGLEGWYDASDGVTTSGDNVTAWADKSGNGNHSTGVTGVPTLVNDEINFWPAVHFRGGNNHLDLGPIVPREEYIVFRSGRYAYNPLDVHKWGPDWGGPFGQQNNNGWMLENNQTRTWTSGANVPLAMVQNGTDLPNVGNAFYMSNVGDYFILKASPQQYGSANGVLGRPNNSWGNGNIDLAEILVFNTPLSTEDEDKVGGYLAQKYGITSTYPLLPVPGLENTGVTGIFLDQAILNASYLGTQSVFDVWVYLNTSDGVQSKAAWLAGSGASYYMGSFTNTDAVLAQPVSGLTGSTTYYYNYYASNVVEEIWGDSVVFGSAGPPTVENRGITNATSTAATLQGELTIGGKAEITLCWGTVDAGTGSTGDWQNVIPLGTNDAGNVFSSTVTDFYYGRTYYYRTYATNGLGDDWSDTATIFNTLQPEGDVTELPVTANLEAWYSADEGITTSGGNVTQWNDRSGNNRHTTSVSGTPKYETGQINGKPAVKFHGGNNNLSINHAITPREEYIVFRSGRHQYDVDPHQWYSDWGGPFGQQNNSGYMFQANTIQTWNSNKPIAMKQNGTNVTEAGSYYYFSDVGDYFVMKANRVNYPSANCRLGRPNDSWGNGYVDVAEVIVYSDTKSAGDEDAIGSYLAWKYGIQTTYPAFTPPNGSTIVNQLVSGIAPAQAQLNASLSSSQAVHDVWAFWSTNDYGTSKANWQADGSSAFVGQFTNAVTDISHFVGGGLTAATTYYYTFYGSNELSEIWGDPATTFQSAGPPAVTNSGADAIGVGVATLNGELIVGGGADVYFAWGSADGGTNGGTAAWQQVIPMGSVLQDTPFSNSIAGLYYGQQYHYRILASNSLGQSWSGLDSFWTLPPPGAPVMRVTDQLGMWFDAGVGVTASGGNVTQWSDQSGNGNHATSPSGTPGLVADALNGYPEIQFINEYLNVNTTSYMREQYVVGRSRNVNWNNYGAFLDGKGDIRDYGYLFDNGQKRFHGNQLPAGVSKNGIVLGGQFDMNPINEYMVLKIDMRNVQAGDRQHYVGRSGHSQSSIDVLEILAYTNELSAADEAEVGGYLGYKYGIGTTYSYSPASAIVVAPTSASDIEVTTATLGGTLDSTQSVFTVTAFWSTNNNAGSAAWLADGAASSAAAGTFTNVINHSISAAAGSLSGATTYYYTFRASNPQTDVWSTANANFETAGPPSAGLAGGATGIGVGVASLRGEVTAGASANAYICWGATDGGTTSIATWDNAVSMGSIVQGNVFTQALANLYYGLDYQYRVYVTNDAGTAWSAVTNFLTLKPTGSSLAILNWDFETGDLTGWTNVGATAGADTLFRNGYSPVSHSRIGPKQGTYYIDGYSSGQGNSDAWTGIIETEAFTLGADANWTFVSGGGTHSWSGTPAAPGTLAGIALERETSPGVWANAIFQSGANNNSLIARNHDLSAYAGDTMRIRIYDNTTGGWGWCGADDFAVSNVLVGSGVDLSIANTVAANVADVTADLQGTLEGTGSVFTVTVYWSTNNNANGAAWLADGSASNAVVGVLTNATGYALDHSVSSLSPSTTYYYTYRANNAATNMWASPNVTFGTSSAPGAPTAGLAGGVTDIGIATASLRGELLGGVFASAYLCYGDNDGGTTTPDAWDNALLVGVVNENEPFTNTLSTLYYGPLYHYRVYVTNSFGTHWSGLDTFSTDVPGGGGTELTADSQTFDAYFEDFDGESWLLIGRGRDLWEFDTDGQGSVDDVSQYLKTTAAFPPACYSDAIVNDLISQAGYTFPGDVPVRLSRATTIDGTGTYQDNRWTGLGGASFTWDFDAGSGLAVTHEIKNAGATPVNDDAYAATTPRATNTRDNFSEGAGDTGGRIFTWPHESVPGFRYGANVTGNLTASTFLYRNQWAVAYTEVYIPYDAPASGDIDIANTGAANVGETTADLEGTLDGTNAIFTVTAYWSTNNNADGAAWLADGSAFTQGQGTFTNVSAQAISASVTGLTSGASYYYTLLAANAQTNLWATPTLPFGTLSAPVASLGAGAQSSDPSSATLYGLLSLGGVADATLVWGITDGGTGSTNAWQNAIGVGSVNQGVAFSNTISSLYYGIGYNYRVYATNGAGESWSALDSFFTAPPVDTSVPVKDTLEVHYDANEGVTTSGSTVTDWLDLSGNGRHLGSPNNTPTLAPNTLNGRPVIEFDQGGEQLNMNNPGDEYFARETFLVFRSRNGTTFGPNWGAPYGAPNGDDADRTWMMWPGEDRFWGDEIPSAVTRNGTTVSSANNFDMGADVGQYMVLKVVSGPNSGTQIRPYVVGTRMDGWADCFVDTAEIIAYSGTTSAGDEDLIGGYLAAKYGITTTYPAYTFGAEQPIVNTTVADLAASTATLTGELDATQSVYTVKVYYGPNDNANGAAWLADGAALSVTVDTLTNVVDYALNVPVTGLTPDATYYYAFLAQNEATNAWATPNESFATFPTLALSNLVATTVTHESATLNGRLIVEGTNADVTVYYGTSDGGTTPGSWDTSVFVGTFTNEINTDFSKSVSGLLSDQYYYYAFFATNGSAGAWGSPSEILLTQLHDPQAPVITGATAHFRGANLTWTDNAGSETAYLVRRSSSGSGGPYTQIASLAADTTSYNDTGGSQLSTYWYRIAATSTVTQSSTDFALAQTSVTTPPEPITQLGILNLNVNNGVNPATGEVWAPGDTYRYVFVSSTFADGTQVGSSYYDNFVQGLANASALNIGANEGVSWKALASFTTGDAHDHTDTNPNTDGTGEAIFMLNGTERIANDYADLWDGSIDTQIDRDENNVAHRTDTSWGGHGSLWTGSNTDGSRSAGNELGSGGNVVFGLSSQVNAHWINRGSQADSTVNSLLRGLSEPLTLRALITLSNLAVTDVTTNSATLNGNLQVPTTNAYITLYWGSTDGTTNKGSWDNAVDLGNWVLEDSTNLSHALSGLTAGADYYYTFYGSNDVLDVWASPSVFFSPLAVPTLNNNGGATAITAASASLNGLMTAGGTANGTIVWGTSAPAALNFGVWDFVEVLGTVNQGVGFTTNVSGLSPETTYYYRAYATNTLGEAWSAITNFTTPRTTHVYIGPNSSNSDQWNVGANWNPNATPLGPVGSVNVEVPVGKLATAWNDSTPAFTGDLTIGVGATVAIGWTTVRPNSYNALGTPGTSTIYMDQGASINVRSGQSPTIPQIQLLGDATYTMSSSTQPNSSPTYAHGIHGPYTFTLRGKSGCVSTFSASNSFAHFVADPLVGDGFPINANVAGAMGSGDITIQSSAGNTVAGNLTINAADAMSDSGTLSISGSASATKITMNANDTVASVVIDGVTQAYGTYGRTGLGGVDFEVSWIAGNGILTIPVPPSGYWDLDGTTAGAGGASPAGVWDGGTANWDSTADGTGAAKVWTAGEPAVFAAGSDANGTYTVNVSGTHDIGGLTVEEGTVTLSGGTLQLSADAPINVAGGLTTTVDSLVSDDGSTRKLTKVGTGSVALNGANSFAGIMRIEDGTVTIGTLAAAGANSGIGAYATAGENGLELAGGTLAYTGGSTTVDRGLTVSGNSILNLSAAGTSLTMGDSQGRDSSGTLTVTGGVGSSLSVGRVTVVEGVTLTLAPSTIPMTVSTVRGYTSYPLPHSPLVLSGASEGNVVSGNIFIENPPLSGFSRPIYVTKTGSGTWTLNGNNSNNRLTVEEGTIAVSSFNNSGATGPLGNNSSADTMGGAGGLSGTIRYTGGPASSNKKFSMATGGTGVFEVATSSTELTLSGVIEGGGVLAKSGAGTLYLTGANTYSGGTEVRGGTLGVAGTIGNLVTVNGGALSPGIGAAITTLTLSNGLTLESGGSLSMQIGTSSDLINVTGGTITGPSSGTVNVAVTDSGGLTLQTYVVIDWTGATPSDMDASDFTSTVPAGYRGWFEISGNTLLLVIIEETTVFMFR